MGARARNADTVIAASAVLAALAMLLLGWQIIQALPRINLAIASRGAELSYPLVLLVGVTVCAGVCALLWALFYSRRAGQRAESRLQWMTHRLPGAFYVFSLGPNDVAAFALMTSNAGSMLGVAPQDVMRDANVARRLIEPEDRERLKIALAHSRAALSALEADFRIRTPDGEVRWLRTLAVPVKESDGTIQWNGHLLDITAIRATEQALRDATQRLEDAQSVARFGDWTCDLATGALTWSPQVFQLLGREPMLGPPSLAELIDMLLEGPEPTTSAFELAQSSGEPQSFEASARLPSGSVVALNVIVLPVSDGAGTVTGMRGTIQDITVRKALELRLSLAKEVADAASLAKSAFLATMSHEIRTPLNGMLGLLELIRLKPADPEIRTALETVKDSGQSLQRIIDDILDFSKVEAGKLAIRPEATSLVDVVDSVHRIYAGSASSLGLELQRHVDPDISPTLMLDAWRLRQILSNFVSNALKFTPKGTVDIRVLLLAREGDFERIRFEVADTGIGISPEKQAWVFEAFAQAESGTSRTYGGTGLGLTIAKQLAVRLGGDLRLGRRP